MITISLHSSLTFLFDTLITLLIFSHWFRELPKREPAVYRGLGGLLVLGSLFILYPNLNLTSYPLRFLIRAVVYLVYLSLLYPLKWEDRIFFSCFATILHTTAQGIVTTPFLYRFLRQNVGGFFPFPFGALLETSLEAALSLLIFWTVTCCAPLCCKHRAKMEWSFLLLIASVEVYVKQTLRELASASQGHDAALDAFSIILQMLLLFLLVGFLRYAEQQQAHLEAVFQETANNYRIQSLEQRLQSSEDLRSLRHDMKNHLRAIRSMAQNAQNDALTAYVNDLLGETQRSEITLETGNALLNGLLADKLHQAERQETDLLVFLDFSGIHFLDDYTLCTLFGNALDNALEACAALPEGQPRRISVRSSIAASHLCIRIENTYAGTLRTGSFLPLTTKADGSNHGLGLRNIRRALRAFRGELVLDTSTPGRFVCSMVIPLPAP